jgi:hypothetical protein
MRDGKLCLAAVMLAALVATSAAFAVRRAKRMRLRTPQRPSSPPAAFVPLSPRLLSSLSAPTHMRCSANDALGALWKAMVAAALGAREAKLMAACKKLWPDNDRDFIKALICTRLAEGCEDELVDALHSLATDRVAALGPKLPEERRQALHAEAAEAAEVWRATLREVRVQSARHATGGPLLSAAARHITSRIGGAAAPSPSRQAGHASRVRGASHEAAASAWARAHWPDAEVATSCHVLASSSARRSGAPSPGVKAEFDALVLQPSGDGGCDGRLLAVVEAKAGPDAFRDLRKMLDARSELLAANAALTVRAGAAKGGRTRRLCVGAHGVHIAYVYGCPGSFDAIAARSVEVALSHVLLEREVESAAAAGDAGAPFQLLEPSGGRFSARVEFGAERVAAQQEHVSAFERAVREVAEARGEVSFWGPAPA